MKSSNLFRAGMIAGALALAGCNASLEDIAPKPDAAASASVAALSKSNGMVRTSQIMMRIFKEEDVLEVWKEKPDGRFWMVASYPLCKWSGKLGPKFTEGDRQAPEGFYSVSAGSMNPNSQFHLSFNTGYPNSYDRVHGRTGSHLMVHGSCSSQGCYSLTDGNMQRVYAFAREAFSGGQKSIQLQIYPFRLTAANMARYKDDPNFDFWTMLKEGYDHFDLTKVPPKVDVCERRYVFNRFAEGDTSFSPAGACPAAPMPAPLAIAYQSKKTKESAAFEAALAKKATPPKASIRGIEEASVVADWSKKRSRGERVPIEPPEMTKDGAVVASARMGRIDAPIGRKMAAIEAAEAEKKRAAEEKKRAAEEKKLAAERAKADAETKRIALEDAAKAPKPEAPQVVESESTISAVKNRLKGFFGG